MSYTLRDDVPVPPRANGSGRADKYPFSQMLVGQSFVVLPDQGQTLTALKYRMSTNKYHASKKLGYKFRVAIENTYIGVWRTA